MKKYAYFGLPLLAILALGAQGFALAPQAEPADITAYRAIAAEKDPAKNAALCEKFLVETGTAFKESIYREPCFQLMFQDYTQLQNVPKILETADRMQQLVPKIRSEVKEAVYGMAMQLAVNNLKDTKKGIVYAEHTLAVNPANLNSLIFLATTIVENLPMDAAAKESAMTKVVEYASKVLAAKKPDTVTDAQWNPILAQQHANIGYVHLIRKNYETSIKTYEESLKLNPKADVSWYRMGLAHEAGPVSAAFALVKENQ